MLTLIKSLATLALMCLCSSPGYADGNSQPHVTGSIMDGQGRIVLYKTDAPHLYYTVPMQWQIDDNQVALSVLPAQHYSLSFVMAPDYQWVKPYEEDVRAGDPQAIFLNVPRQYVSVIMSVPTALGDITSRITPTDLFSSGDIFYYQLDLTAKELAMLRLVTKNNTSITGTVSYKFPYADTSFQTNANVMFNLTLDQLARADAVPDRFVYLRCTATSWDELSPSALLTSDPNDPTKLMVDIGVDQDWMTQGGDDCTITGSSQPHEWADISNYKAAADGQLLTGVAYGTAKTIDMETFNLQYPKLGTYRLLLDRMSGVFSVVFREERIGKVAGASQRRNPTTQAKQSSIQSQSL